MSAVVAERPRLSRETDRPSRRDDAPRRRPDLTGGDRPTTLEQRLERVWEGLVASCPVCGSDGSWTRLAVSSPLAYGVRVDAASLPATPTSSSEPHADVIYRCRDCGSTIA